MEEPDATATATIALTLSEHQAAYGAANQYSAAVTEDAEDDADILLSNLVCHPAVTIFAYGGVGNSVLIHLEKQSTS